MRTALAIGTSRCLSIIHFIARSAWLSREPGLPPPFAWRARSRSRRGGRGLGAACEHRHRGFERPELSLVVVRIVNELEGAEKLRRLPHERLRERLRADLLLEIARHVGVRHDRATIELRHGGVRLRRPLAEQPRREGAQVSLDDRRVELALVEVGEEEPDGLGAGLVEQPLEHERRHLEAREAAQVLHRAVDEVRVEEELPDLVALGEEVRDAGHEIFADLAHLLQADAAHVGERPEIAGEPRGA